MSDYTYSLATHPVEIGKCMRVRHDVFVEEQGIDKGLEIRDNDRCVHFLGKHTQENFGGSLITSAPVAAARIFPKESGVAKIQRLAVLARHRKHGVGADLMRFMIEHAKGVGYQCLELGSQVDAVGFYEKLGFVPFDDQYEEAGIMHQNMRLTF